MADTTTELEVLDDIVDVLGGTSGQYETVVPTLRQIKELLGGGGAVPDGAVTFPKLSQDVQDAIEEGGSGYNPSLSVGRADALTGADSTAQWAQRESTGTGSATVRSVQGAAVAFNQYIKDAAANWSAISGVASYADGVVTMTPNGGDGFTYADVRQTFGVNSVAGHKYLVSFDFLREHWDDISQADNYCFPTLYGMWLLTTATLVPSKSVTTWQHLSGIITQQNDGQTGVLSVRCYGATYPLSIKNVMLFDLTAMFGSGNEPATVAEFEQMFPASYYPYSAPTLKPVRIAGISSTDAQGGELDAIEWDAFTLRGAGSVADMLYADHVDVNVGVVDLGTLNWNSYSAGSPVVNYPNVRYALLPSSATGFTSATLAQVANVNVVLQNETATLLAYQQTSILLDYQRIYISSTDLAGKTAAQVKEYMAGIVIYYALPTTTTTPISPALPMTYKVQADGSESIIVPDGDISAAPLITLAEGESAAELVMDALACIATPDGPTATANHAINTYLTMGGKLYKVTSAIAVGESIVAGTNVTQTTVMSELLALTA